MDGEERRLALLDYLRCRRHETVSRLAEEFGVSERTVRRDIARLSLREPLYTQCGRYGGVYVLERPRTSRTFTEEEVYLLGKLCRAVKEAKLPVLTETEQKALSVLASRFLDG